MPLNICFVAVIFNLFIFRSRAQSEHVPYDQGCFSLILDSTFTRLQVDVQHQHFELDVQM